MSLIPLKFTCRTCGRHHKCRLLTRFWLAAAYFFAATTAWAWPAVTQDFPLEPSAQWVLKEPVFGSQVVFQVVSSASSGSTVRITTPYSSADLQLTVSGMRYQVTGYGTEAGLAPLPS